MAIRVLLADDQAMVRTGFAMILGALADVEIVGASERLKTVARGR